jgi:hypothetical protein
MIRNRAQEAQNTNSRNIHEHYEESRRKSNKRDMGSTNM